MENIPTVYCKTCGSELEVLDSHNYVSTIDDSASKKIFLFCNNCDCHDSGYQTKWIKGHIVWNENFED